MSKKINVLSLFDGISCSQQALKNLGIACNYYASEIEDYAMEITQKNFPKTFQLGNVAKLKVECEEWILEEKEFPPWSENSGKVWDSSIEKDVLWSTTTLQNETTLWSVPKFDLVVGGSPCQGFSNSGYGKGFEDERSKLFWHYVRILKEVKRINPDVKFLLENVKMKEECRNIITKELGVEPVEINSVYYTGQNRVRLYWTNLDIPPQRQTKKTFKEVMLPLEEVADKEVRDITDYNPKQCRNYIQFDKSGKGYKSIQDRIYSGDNRFCTLSKATGRTKYKVLVENNEGRVLYRHLDLREAEALQGLPHGYTHLGSEASVKFSIGKSLGSIGNGMTVQVMEDFFSSL